MNFNTLNFVKGLEFEISESLSLISPVDYVDWVKISVVGGDGFLYTMGENKKMITATAYLQDNNFDILFDNLGFPLEGDTSSNAFSSPWNRRRLYPEATNQQSGVDEELYALANSGHGAMRNINTSAYNENGEFKIDLERGAIAFSSEIAEQSIVLEYVADGLENEKIWGEALAIHKYIVDAIMDYVYWQVIRKKRNVILTEKAVARHEYFNSRRLAKIRLGSINANEIRKAMSAATKWI